MGRYDVCGGAMRVEEVAGGAEVAATAGLLTAGVLNDCLCADGTFADGGSIGGVRAGGVLTAGDVLLGDCHRGSVPKLYDGVDRWRKFC